MVLLEAAFSSYAIKELFVSWFLFNYYIVTIMSTMEKNHYIRSLWI